MFRSLPGAVLIFGLWAVPWTTAAQDHAAHDHAAHDHAAHDHAAHESAVAAQAAAATDTAPVLGLSRIPDVELVDQHGQPVNFYSDLVQGKVVAMNFIFTTCTTICSPMGAIFGKLQRDLGDRDVQLISVSVDPVTDTPERLKAWSERFGAQPGWTLVTGDKTRVDELLKALQVFTPDFRDHSPTVLIGNDPAGVWRRAYGLAPVDRLTAVLDQVSTDETAADRQAEMKRAREYFSDTVLLDQDGRPQRFYSDLLQDKTVVISPFFTTCDGACPMLTHNLAKVQERFRERMGEDLHLISISVDPEVDTPPRNKAYAARFDAGPGWYFLTGAAADVDQVLYKIGQYTETKEGHSNVFIMGNEPQRSWRKVFGLGADQDVLRQVEELLDGGP